MLFNSIKTMMTSATDSSVPLIVPAEELVRANSVTMTINALSMFLGPALGGVLMGMFELETILIISSISLTLAAIMEMFIHIPNVKQKSSGNMFADITRDIFEGFRFAIKSKPIIIKILLVVCATNLLANSIAFIGSPVIILRNLGMSQETVGISLGFSAIGGLVGGAIAGILGEKLRIQKAHWVLIIVGILLLPLCLVFFITDYVFIALCLLTAVIFLIAGLYSIFTIQVMAFVQLVTPTELLGKMMGLVMLVGLLGLPIGNWLLGFLFDNFAEHMAIIFLIAALLVILIALWSRKHFKNIPPESKAEDSQ